MADIPSGPRTTATLPRDPNFTYGVLETGGDSDWYRITLNRGVNYAFNGDVADPTPDDGTADIAFSLRDPAGRVLRTGRASEGEDFSGGFEFRPTRTGTYFVEVTGREAVGYNVRAAADAAPDLQTRASLAVGDTNEVSFFYAGDTDLYRVQLQRGRSYDFALDDEIGELAMLDGRGRVLAVGEEPADFSDGLRIEGFRAPSTGTFFLRADEGGADFGREYAISAALAGGGAGPATVTLTAGDDTFSADDRRAVTVRGLAGDDDIDAFGPGSTVFGDDGDDNLFADSVFGGAGSDELRPGRGGAADGGPGDDLIQVGGRGATVVGGQGRDTYLMNGGSADPEDRDTLADFDPVQDVISLANAANTFRAASDPLTFIGTAAFSEPDQVRYGTVGGVTLVEVDEDGDGAADLAYEIPREVRLTAANFLLGVPAGPGDDAFAGTPYADEVGGYAGNDRLSGAAGIDSLRGDEGDDLLDGGDGRDRLFGDEGADTILGGAGDDYLIGGRDDDEIRGGPGDDEIVDGEGADRLLGEDGNDLITGGNSGSVFGGAGNDVLRSGGGGAWLSGEDGDDRLGGGFGVDELLGGAGNDRFVFGRDYLDEPGAADTILDFARGDRIDVSGIDANRGAAGEQAFAFVGTRGFTGAGQLRFTSDGGETLIEGSTDLDRLPEFRIALDDGVALTAADFVL
jgi:Ca2+-binding RTX toxin-like protein